MKIKVVIKSNQNRHPAGTPGGKGGEFATAGGVGKRRGRTFYAGSTTYTCSDCGKRTRDTGNDEKSVGLCIDCYVDSSMDNHMGNDGSAENAPKLFGKYGEKWLKKWKKENR